MPNEEDTFADWEARFAGSKNEPTEYGVASMVVLDQEDQFSCTESITYCHRGGVIRLLGMMGHTVRALQEQSSKRFFCQGGTPK